MKRTDLSGQMTKRSHNWGYWVTIGISTLAAVLAVGGVDIMSVHSFPQLMHNLLDIVSDPSLLVLVAINVLGISYNPTTKGFGGKSSLIDDEPVGEPAKEEPAPQPEMPVPEPAADDSTPPVNAPAEKDKGLTWGPVKGDDDDGQS